MERGQRKNMWSFKNNTLKVVDLRDGNIRNIYLFQLFNEHLVIFIYMHYSISILKRSYYFGKKSVEIHNKWIKKGKKTRQS